METLSSEISAPSALIRKLDSNSRFARNKTSILMLKLYIMIMYNIMYTLSDRTKGIIVIRGEAIDFL